MEFDHVIVVEPTQIVKAAADGQELRELFVALIRPSMTIVVVHDRPPPVELGL
jgi:DNA helicase IV